MREKALLTGGSGFLGRVILATITDWEITTLARTNADINTDIINTIPILPIIDVVIHCAGKAHLVPKTDVEKQDFFNVNVQGTQNLLGALAMQPKLPRAFVLISTVAVYGKQCGTNFNEETPLMATDAYGLSKIKAEKIVSEWCEKNHVKCTILRLPLLAGSNPPGNLGAMIRGIKKGYYFNIAGGKAKKSIVLANDVAKIIPTAAEMGGTYNLTDGVHPSFAQLSKMISSQLKKKPPLNMPYFIAKALAITGDLLGKISPINSDKLHKIISDLTFNDSKAIEILKWKPQSVLKSFTLSQ